MDGIQNEFERKEMCDCLFWNISYKYTMNRKELLNLVNAVVHRNSIILANFNQKAQKDAVNLHWWKISGAEQNVGDYLSTIVVEFVKKLYITEMPVSGRKTVHLMAVGSIIDASYQDAVIWGSGLLRGKDKYWWRIFRKLDIRSVRGPETRRILIDNGYSCPEVYGDPAILMPLIYQSANTMKLYDYRIIPHMAFGISYPNVLSPYTSNWKKFIDEIIQSKLIISSSLHGIILAEAYGVPAILLNDHDMNLFKYRDYYYSTGRYTFPVAKTIEEGLTMKPAPIPDFEKLRKGLLDSFPVDLWSIK